MSIEQENINAIREAGIEYNVSTFNTKALNIAQEGKPKIRYFPMTSRWFVYPPGKSKIEMRGTAKAFIKWLSNL